jgi:hypothetical protein
VSLLPIFSEIRLFQVVYNNQYSIDAWIRRIKIPYPAGIPFFAMQYIPENTNIEIGPINGGWSLEFID